MNKYAYRKRRTVQCHQVFADRPDEWPNPVLRVVYRSIGGGHASVGHELSTVNDGDWVVEVGDYYPPFLLSDEEFHNQYIKAVDDDGGHPGQEGDDGQQ